MARTQLGSVLNPHYEQHLGRKPYYEPEEIEAHFCGSATCDGGCQERAVEQFDRGQM